MSYPSSHPNSRPNSLRTAVARASDALHIASALAVVVALALLFQVGTAFGAGGDSSDSPPSVADMIDDAENHIDDEEYDDAIALLEKARAEDPNDPDILNWLGYSHRKLGNYDTSLEFYTAALAQDPEHLGANEYLGELYLLLNDLPKAEERLAVLAATCDSDCEEYEELLAEIEEYKETNGQS